MRRWGLWLVIIAALVGGIFSAIALRHYVSINGANLSAPSFCNINEQFNCDMVTASSYAAVADLPVSGVSLLFFAVQLLFGFWALKQRDARGPAAVGLGFAILALLPALYLGYVMAAILHTYCISCLMIDLSVLLVLAGWWGSGAGLSALRQRHAIMAPIVVTLIIGAVGILFLVNLGAATSGNQRPSAQLMQRALAAHFQQPEQKVDFKLNGRPVWGADKPVLQILEFSDFQCPFCREAAFRVKPYLAEFRNQVQLVFLNYPLDQACNTDIQRPMHAFACQSARAALCAHDQGKFWAFHDAVFRDQQKITPDFLQQTAKNLGLDMGRFEICLKDPTVDARIQEDLAMGHALRISGTPAVFVNGRQLHNGWQNKEFLRAVINHELEQRSHAK